MVAEPTRLRAQLAKELLRVRDLAGFSGRELARRIGLSQPTLSRIDRALTVPSVPQVQAWLTECGVDPDAAERVLALAEAAHGETRPWADLLLGREHLQDEVRRRDLDARLVRNFQPTVVPGLLQTAEYARSILALGRTNQEAALAARLEYQQVLHEPERRFAFVVDERALQWEPGPGALTGQLDHLASVAVLDSVDLAVLPAEAAPLIPWHNFVIRDSTASGPAYVTTELIHGTQELTDPVSVAVYERAWGLLRAAAVVGDDARNLLARLARQYREPVIKLP